MIVLITHCKEINKQKQLQQRCVWKINVTSAIMIIMNTEIKLTKKMLNNDQVMIIMKLRMC